MDELMNNNSLLTEIDKKIVLRFKKLKGKNKTCVYNLDKFMEQPKVEESKTAKRLRELDSLLKQQLITQDEYDKKRKEILYSF